MQITSDILVCFKALKCFQTLFQSQLWQATSTSWSTSCPSSLRPSWTLTTSKISLIAVTCASVRLLDDVRSCARTGQHRPMLCCVVLYWNVFQLCRTVWALHCTAVHSGGVWMSVQRCRLRALWQWPNATNTDIKDSGPYMEPKGPCTQSHMTKLKHALEFCVLWNRMLQNSCVSFPQHANIDVCGVFSSSWYTNGDYLVLIVTLVIILPLSLLKNLGKCSQMKGKIIKVYP